MDEDTIFAIAVASIFIACCLIITVGVVLNEYLETPQDKCVDSCLIIEQEQAHLRRECVDRCNEVFSCSQSREGVSHD